MRSRSRRYRSGYIMQTLTTPRESNDTVLLSKLIEKQTPGLGQWLVLLLKQKSKSSGASTFDFFKDPVQQEGVSLALSHSNSILVSLAFHDRESGNTRLQSTHTFVNLIIKRSIP